MKTYRVLGHDFARSFDSFEQAEKAAQVQFDRQLGYWPVKIYDNRAGECLRVIREPSYSPGWSK